MKNFRMSSLSKILSVFIALSFLSSAVFPAGVHASEIFLPAPTQFVNLSQTYSFPVLKSLKFDPANPLRMEFIIDTADQKNLDEQEAARLIKYFLAGLTIPDKDTWVNLSPYEKERIIPDTLAETNLGEDLLSQDYLLKQLSASLTYPEGDIGKDFWTKTYEKVLTVAKTTKIPVNTFNKIWIMPDSAEVYENGNVALVTKATLKTMLEEDYLALQKETVSVKANAGIRKETVSDLQLNQINKVTSGVVREVILPKISREVNSGKNFATLRQIYHSLILGAWFKKKFQDSLYRYYIDKGKVNGIDLQDKGAKEKIYNLYVEAFKKGVYNYIKSEKELATGRRIKRQYFSGGFTSINIGSILQRTDASSAITSFDETKGVKAVIDLSLNTDNNAQLVAAVSSPMKHIYTYSEAVAYVKDEREKIIKMSKMKRDGLISEDPDVYIKAYDKVVQQLFDDGNATFTFFDIQQKIVNEIKVQRGIKDQKDKIQSSLLSAAPGPNAASPIKYTFKFDHSSSQPETEYTELSKRIIYKGFYKEHGKTREGHYTKNLDIPDEIEDFVKQKMEKVLKKYRKKDNYVDVNGDINYISDPLESGYGLVLEIEAPKHSKANLKKIAYEIMYATEQKYGKSSSSSLSAASGPEIKVSSAVTFDDLRLELDNKPFEVDTLLGEYSRRIWIHLKEEKSLNVPVNMSLLRRSEEDISNLKGTKTGKATLWDLLVSYNPNKISPESLKDVILKKLKFQGFVNTAALLYAKSEGLQELEKQKSWLERGIKEAESEYDDLKARRDAVYNQWSTEDMEFYSSTHRVPSREKVIESRKSVEALKERLMEVNRAIKMLKQEAAAPSRQSSPVELNQKTAIAILDYIIKIVDSIVLKTDISEVTDFKNNLTNFLAEWQELTGVDYKDKKYLEYQINRLANAEASVFSAVEVKFLSEKKQEIQTSGLPPDVRNWSVFADWLVKGARKEVTPLLGELVKNICLLASKLEVSPVQSSPLEFTQKNIINIIDASLEYINSLSNKRADNLDTLGRFRYKFEMLESLGPITPNLDQTIKSKIEEIKDAEKIWQNFLSKSEANHLRVKKIDIENNGLPSEISNWSGVIDWLLIGVRQEAKQYLRELLNTVISQVELRLAERVKNSPGPNAASPINYKQAVEIFQDTYDDIYNYCNVAMFSKENPRLKIHQDAATIISNKGLGNLKEGKNYTEDSLRSLIPDGAENSPEGVAKKFLNTRLDIFLSVQIINLGTPGLKTSSAITTGGIDMQSIDVSATPNSSPVSFTLPPDFNPVNLQISIKSIRLEAMPKLGVFLNLVEDTEKQENIQLALAK